MPRSGPRKIYRYSDEFRLTAVRLSQQPGMQVQTVAAALEIHPFMLSKWRKEPNARSAAPSRNTSATTTSAAYILRSATARPLRLNAGQHKTLNVHESGARSQGIV